MTKEQAIAAPLTVLAIDDDADVLRATERILREAGFRVVTGATAAAALELTRLHHPALVLLDVMLPDGNGLDVARRLKGDPALADVFVILYSGSKVSSDDQAKGLVEGLADGYMTRPLSKPELLARIEAFLRIRETQQALRESEAKYRLLIENSHDIIYTLTADGVFTFVSPAWTALLGHPLDQVAGQPFQQFVHPDDLPGCMVFLQSVIETGQRQEGVEYRVRHLDGSWYWHTSSAVPLRDEAGTVIGFEGIARDITDRKRAETALTHSHDLMRYIIEHNRSAVAVHDRDLKYIYVSERYLHDYGVTEQDVIGKRHYDVFPDLPQKWRDVHQKALAGEISSAEDDPYVREDGSVDWTRWECRPWYEADGSIGGIIVYTEVITARKQAENALLESEERFRRVSEATSDFAYSCVRPPGGPFSFDWLTGAVEPITGWSREELLEWGCWKALVLEEDVPVFGERVIGLAPGESSACELRNRDKQGGVRWLAAYSVAEHDAEDPAVHRLYGACQDITARKRAEEELLESLAAQRTITEGVIAALVRTIEVRDPYTAGHQRRVSRLAAAMARRMGLAEERAEGLRVGGLLHDVGMVSIPAEILSRPGRLATLELELVKAHAQAGYEILEAIHFPGASPRSLCSTTSAWTAPAIRRGSAARTSCRRRASSPSPTSSRRWPRTGPTGPRSASRPPSPRYAAAPACATTRAPWPPASRCSRRASPSPSRESERARRRRQRRRRVTASPGAGMVARWRMGVTWPGASPIRRTLAARPQRRDG